jgi:hypothetical protein
MPTESQTPNTPTTNYTVLISDVTKRKIETYLEELKKNKTTGTILKIILEKKNIEIASLTPQDLLNLLFETKEPNACSESHNFSTNQWSEEEISILGDCAIAANVEIYDNGVHNQESKYFKIHNTPINGTLLFVPGALLVSSSPDLKETQDVNQLIDQEKLTALYERRLVPSLIHANNTAGTKGAIITLPGIGCGNFAGDFQGQIEKILQQALLDILTKHAARLPNIKAVIFDVNDSEKCTEGNIIINDSLDFTTVRGQFGKFSSQLKHPAEYGEKYKKCKLYSIVAWDHLAWPGNDFNHNFSRFTDDGVKGAATNVIEVVTGIKGVYEKELGRFMPSKVQKKLLDWQSLSIQNGITLNTNNLVEIPLHSATPRSNRNVFISAAIGVCALAIGTSFMSRVTDSRNNEPQSKGK